MARKFKISQEKRLCLVAGLLLTLFSHQLGTQALLLLTQSQPRLVDIKANQQLLKASHNWVASWL